MHSFRAAFIVCFAGLVASVVGAIANPECAASTVTVTVEVETIPAWCKMTSTALTLVPALVPTEDVPATETIATATETSPPMDDITTTTTAMSVSVPAMSIPTSVPQSTATTVESVASDVTSTTSSVPVTRSTRTVQLTTSGTGSSSETPTAQTSAPPATAGSNMRTGSTITMGMLVACSLVSFVFAVLA